MNRINKWVLRQYCQQYTEHAPDRRTDSEAECAYETSYAWGFGHNRWLDVMRSRFKGHRNPDHESLSNAEYEAIPVWGDGGSAGFHVVPPRARSLIISQSWRIW